MGSKGRSGADLLLVVGTSLRVPGTKRMVRLFSKAVRSRVSNTSATKEDGGSSSASSSSASQNSARPSPNNDEEQSMKAVYLNLDFPVPTREWEGIFDVWLQGDAQQFARLLQEELEKQAKAKELAVEKKKKREEEAALAAANTTTTATTADPTTTTTKTTLPTITPKPSKRKSKPDSTTSKRRKIVLPPSPPESPPTSHPNSDTDIDMLPPLPSEAGPSSASTSASASAPLTIRIPPRNRACYVEIPPFSLRTPTRSAILKLPPTPEDTPPSRYRLPVAACHRSTHILAPPPPLPPPPTTTTTSMMSVRDLTSSIIEIGLSEDEMDDYDALPISCLRSTQIGLGALSHR